MRVLAAVALLSLPFLAQAGQAEAGYRYRYMVHELGAPEDIVSVADAISQDGKYSAGRAWHDATQNYQAALFQTGLRRTFILPGGTSEASGVNSGGEVVGTFWDPAEGPWLTSRRAFHWRSGVLTPLPQFGSGSTVANAINERGVIAGWFHATTGEQHGFTYRNGVFRDLGTWGGAAAEITSINYYGDVAGMRYRGDPLTQEAVRVVGGRVNPLGNLLPQGLGSLARSINDRGDVAGVAFDGAVEGEGPGAWPFAVFGNKLVWLVPQIAGWGGGALGINNKRQIVGGYSRPPEGGGAFLWEDGKLTDLSNLPEVKAAGWVQLHTAIAINDDGVIVGAGLTTGDRMRGFMLVPLRGR
jgi:probable HAF family extracellular repeat protein